MRMFFLIIAVVMFLAGQVWSQGETPRWQRRADTAPSELHLFRSTHGITLPTAETMQKGEFEFEISHRFAPTFDDGVDYLFGLDGPVNMRLGLGYAVTDRLIVTLGRSNVLRNLDLQLKYRAFSWQNEHLPTLVAIRIASSWSTVKTSFIDANDNLIVQPKRHKRHFQYYAQAIFNVMPHKRLGLGLVPSFLVNRTIDPGQFPNWKNSAVFGTNAAFYFNRYWALIGEWSIIMTDKFGSHNPGAVGVELNTGGHFFKIFVTNQTLVNQSQYLAGSEETWYRKNLRLGFMITRLI